ncbi:hypothetical protein WMY93_020758 [Mugilogobius chulae]|uniref:Uncharacterized protein n=1 Tax=Mugilogobius chulae TaxID=88201 RepID=A0AAW0N8S5_9GOBI
MRSTGEEQTLPEEEEENFNVSNEQESCLGPSAPFGSEEEEPEAAGITSDTLIGGGIGKLFEETFGQVFLLVFEVQTVCEEEEESVIETEENTLDREEGSEDMLQVTDDAAVEEGGSEDPESTGQTIDSSVKESDEEVSSAASSIEKPKVESSDQGSKETVSLEVKTEEKTQDLDGYRTPVGFASDESSSTDEQEISGEEQNEAEELEQTAEESGSILSALLKNITIRTEQEEGEAVVETSASESESLQVKREETTVEKPDLDGYRTPVGFASDESSSTDEQEISGEEQNEAEELEQTAEESGSILSALIQNMTIWTKQKDEAVSLETSASESESSEVKTEETTVEKPDLNAYRTPVGFASEESSSTDEYESLEEEQNEEKSWSRLQRNELQLYLHQRN